ncbi:DUF7519 family protein [Haloarcula salina]|uniref:DUF7519 family protein n=1 Tax=Haloarcula salina TaxID=1429914 RepID=UPI003C6ED911
MVLGPRLDTPSAVGDEGRPRATSLTLAALLVVAFALATGVLSGDPRLFAGLALLTGVATAGVALLDREALAPTVAGHLCFLPAASGVLALFVSLSVETPLLLGVTLALVGVTTGWADVFDRETLASATTSSVISYFFGVVAVILLAFVAALAWLCWTALTTAAGGASPAASLAGLFVLALAATACVYFAVTQLPLVELAARSRRDATARSVAQGKRALRLVALVAGAAALTLPLAALFAPVLRMLSTPPGSVVLGLLSSRVAFASLAGVALLALLSGLGAVVVRTLTTEFDAASTRTVGAAIAAVGYLLLLSPVGLRLGVGSTLGPVAVTFGALLLPLGVFAVAVLVLVALRLGLVPERAGPPALTAAGLVCASVGAAQAGLPSTLVFGGVAAGLVAWDVGTFGLGLTAELGHRPETQRLELYHGAFAVGVGLLGVAGVSALELARQSVGTAVGSPETMGIAAVGVLLLLATLRG